MALAKRKARPDDPFRIRGYDLPDSSERLQSLVQSLSRYGSPKFGERTTEWRCLSHDAWPALNDQASVHGAAGPMLGPSHVQHRVLKTENGIAMEGGYTLHFLLPYSSTNTDRLALTCVW